SRAGWRARCRAAPAAPDRSRTTRCGSRQWLTDRRREKTAARRNIIAHEGGLSGMAAVRINALVKRYGSVAALCGVDLEVAAGEGFALVGANGAGKTTLIRCLLDLAACDAGTIELFDSAASNPAARRRLAYLPERFNPPHYLRGAEFLRAMLALGG